MDYHSIRTAHQEMFPIDYDNTFFEQAVGGLNGILSWAAVRYVSKHPG